VTLRGFAFRLIALALLAAAPGVASADWKWQWRGPEGQSRRVQPAQKPTMGLKAYRLPEAKTALKKLARTDFLFVSTFSGDGVSKFFLPRLREQLGQPSVVIDLTGDGFVSDPDGLIQRLGTQLGGLPPVLIFDEVGALSDAGQRNLAALAHKHRAANPANRSIFLVGGYEQRASALVHDLGLAGRVDGMNLDPRPFNQRQMREYLSDADPEFGDLEAAEQRRLVSLLARNLPLHFRLKERKLGRKGLTALHSDTGYLVAPDQEAAWRDSLHDDEAIRLLK
jgi:hypothetical protein